MYRPVAATFLMFHGLIHILGFLRAWQFADLAEMPYSTLILNGTLDVGDVGIRLVGLAWLVAAMGVVVAAIALWRLGARSLRLVAAAAALSLVVSVVGLPAAYLGVFIDVGILAALGVLAVLRPSDLRAVAR